MLFRSPVTVAVAAIDGDVQVGGVIGGGVTTTLAGSMIIVNVSVAVPQEFVASIVIV